ncbi:hypothetical protein YC2023_061049 [Brassica napus]
MDKTSSSEFPRNFVKSPNGSPTTIIFPRNSSVFSEEHSFPRNFLGIFRRTATEGVPDGHYPTTWKLDVTTFSRKSKMSFDFPQTIDNLRCREQYQ